MLSQAAIKMASKGWRIHPLVPKGKRPILDGWPAMATNDVETVASWWKKYRDANIGIATGGHIIVVDCDVKHGINGIDEWTGFCISNSIDDETLTAKTPSGGLHLYFLKKGEIHNSASKIAPGVDVRGDGGYVVAPPSVTRDGAYKWDDVTAILPFPEMLVEKLKYVEPLPVEFREPTGKNCSHYVNVAIQRELERLENAVDGTKHDTLNRVSFCLGQLVGSEWANVDRGDIESWVWAIVEQLPNVEDYNAAQRTMMKGIDDGMANPRPEPTNDFWQKVGLFGADLILPSKPLLIVDDPDTATMAMQTAGVKAVAPETKTWAMQFSKLIAQLKPSPVIVWLKDVAKAADIANRLLAVGCNVRLYRGEAQDLKGYLRGLL